MADQKFFYRFEPIVIDFSDEREIRKYGRELHSFDDLSTQLKSLRSAFEQATKVRADIIVNMLPSVSGAVELTVFHKIRYKFFSHTLKKNCFSIDLLKYNEADVLGMYFYETTDFSEVVRIFSDLIEKRTLPELQKWKYSRIG